MSRSERLRLSDVRSVFRLLGEVRELGAEPRAWRRHMLESLGRTIGMRVGLSGELRFDAGAPVAVPESLVDVGGPDVPNWQGFTRFVASPEASRCPVFATITRWQARGRTVNYRRGRIDRPFDARTWYASELLEHCRAAGLMASLYSQYAVPFGRAAHVIVLNRVRGEAEFTDGQRRLLHLFHAELARLWRLQGRDVPGDLRPRLRQTLDALRAGASEKQVARGLGLSPHTVHNYVKELHRYFGVSSRGELLAQSAIGPGNAFVPALSISVRSPGPPLRPQGS